MLIFVIPTRRTKIRVGSFKSIHLTKAARLAHHFGRRTKFEMVNSLVMLIFGGIWRGILKMVVAKDGEPMGHLLAMRKPRACTPIRYIYFINFTKSWRKTLLFTQ